MGVNNLPRVVTHRHAVTGDRTSDLVIVSPTPYRCATTPSILDDDWGAVDCAGRWSGSGWWFSYCSTSSLNYFTTGTWSDTSALSSVVASRMLVTLN